MAKWYCHTENFDDYTAVINGVTGRFRLTIFRVLTKRNIRKAQRALDRDSVVRPTVIVYQADAKNPKKLKRCIGNFRYSFTKNEYDNYATLAKSHNS